ncbi:MAG: histidine kinase [Flavobacteriales bacterium]|nr:histidine kinase [Flavobacteriales bacterium]
MKKHWKDNRQYIGFNDWPLILVGIPMVSVIFPMLFFGVGIKDSFGCFSQNVFPSILFTSIFWYGDRTITIYFRKKFHKYEQYAKRLYVSGSVILIYTILMSLLLHKNQHFFEHIEPLASLKPSFGKSLAASLLPTALVTLIYEAAFFFSRWKESIAETERLKKENTLSQLEALRNQVNPHFLFNSLNTLVSIIPEDPKKSVEFVQKLSHVYRCILDLQGKTIISLEEEMECLENYRFLLETRFGESIHFDVRINEDERKKYIVPMAVQMLVENAVKHNVVSIKKPLSIGIIAEDEFIVVSNNLQKKMSGVETNGMGLKNINQRFILTFHREIDVSENELSFEVRLPLMNIEQYHGKP